MSFGEILVVGIVGLLVMKPEDLPKILSFIRQLKLYFANFKKDIFTYIDKEFETDKKLIIEDMTEINFYIQEIINLGGNHKGSYSLEDLKTEYNNLVKDKIAEHRKQETAD